MNRSAIAKFAACATAATAGYCGEAGGEVPFSAIRLRKPHTDRAEVWKGTLAEFAKYREGVDEVWFSTGICFPKMDEHRAAMTRKTYCGNHV